jgi:hypothetical protein
LIRNDFLAPNVPLAVAARGESGRVLFPFRLSDRPSARASPSRRSPFAEGRRVWRSASSIGSNGLLRCGAVFGRRGSTSKTVGAFGDLSACQIPDLVKGRPYFLPRQLRQLRTTQGLASNTRWGSGRMGTARVPASDDCSASAQATAPRRTHAGAFVRTSHTRQLSHASARRALLPIGWHAWRCATSVCDPTLATAAYDRQPGEIARGIARDELFLKPI